MLDKFDKKENPFTVPQNYFEELTKNVMTNLPQQETKQMKRVALWKKAVACAAAAAVAGILVLVVNPFGEVPNMLMTQNGEDAEMVKTQPDMAYNESEDFFLFLEDESLEAQYEEVLFDEEY